MSRSRLTLYEVDRAALAAFSSELRAVLVADDRDRLIELLKLEGMAAGTIRDAARALYPLLAVDGPSRSAEIFAALRRAAGARALREEWSSDSLALEGRLRGFDGVREDEAVAGLVDALLDGNGVPWFLRHPGATCGLLTAGERDTLADALERLDDAPPEILAFAHALAAVGGDVLCHDTL